MADAILLETAASIAHRLSRRAIWSGSSCTWEAVTAASRYGPRTVTLAGPHLYSGTAGIGLFFGEAYALTREPGFLRAAKGALQHAVEAHDGQLVWPAGLYTGGGGIAYVAERLGFITSDQSFIDLSHRIVRLLLRSAPDERRHDLIGGMSEAIVGLLAATRSDRPDETLDVVCRWGDALIRNAVVRPRGWSWRSGIGTLDLCGVAHGGSGVAYAFLELWAATGERKYLVAAEEALEYESWVFDPERGNWPDFRSETLSALSYGKPVEDAELRAAIGQPPAYAVAWCHGAPGMAMVRARAFQLTGDQAYRDQVEIACATTEESVRRHKLASYCLCHGLFGNIDALLFSTSMLPGRKSVPFAVDFAIAAADRCEGQSKAWPGQAGEAIGPGLFTGEAGIGYFYLRLVRAERLESVLLMNAARRDVAEQIVDQTPPQPTESIKAELHKSHLQTFFKSTGRALQQALHGHERGGDVRLSGSGFEIRAQVEAICQRLAPPDAARVQHACRLELAGFDLVSDWRDAIDDRLAQAFKPMLADIDWDTAAFRLARATTFVSFAERHPESLEPESPWRAEIESSFVIARETDGLRYVRAGGALEVMFSEMVRTNTTAVALVDVLYSQLEPTPDFPSVAEKLRTYVREQLKSMYVSGLIELAPIGPTLRESEGW